MSAGRFSDLPQVQQVLDRCRRQILQHTFLVGLATVLIAVVGYLLTVSLLDYAIGLPGIVRAAVLLLFVATAAYVVWRHLLVPLRLTTPAQQLGAAIDLTCPHLQESLSTLISIQSPDATSSEAGSVQMQQRLQKQVAEQLRSLGPQQFVNSQQMKKRCGLAALILAVALVPLILWPSASALSIKRLVQPFANLANVSNLFFDVENGNRTVARWSNVVLHAKPAWRNGAAGERPDLVQLKLTAANGQSDTIAMAFDEVNGCYTYQLSRIADPLQFQIIGGGATSEKFQITVVDAPSVEMAMMTAVPPAYTGHAVQRFEGMTETMKVFERSDLQIHLEFNKPVQSAELVWTRRDERPLTASELFDIEFDNLTGEEVPMIDLEAPTMPAPEPLIMRSAAELSEDRLSAFLNLQADVGGDFEFVIVDDFDLKNPTEPERSMSVTFDQAPKLKVSGIRNEDQYRANDILPINCYVADDIGVGSVELHYSINDTPSVVVPAVDFDPGDREVSQRFRLILEDLNVKDGDWLTVRIRATDERPEPGPHEVWSDEISIEINKDALPPGARALQQETQEIIEALKQLENQLAKDKKRAEELQLAARREWNDGDRDQVRRLSEKEQQQGRILEQLAGEVATHPMMKDEAEALQQLVPELRETLPEMLEQAAEENRIAAPATLQSTGETIEDVRRELQLQIDALEKKAKLEQDLAELNRLALDAEQLAQDADKLETDRQHPENKPEDVAQEDWEQQLQDRQQELATERQELTDGIEQLLEEERELLEAAQRAQTERFDELKQAAQELADQQTLISDGVKDEAKKTVRDAFQIAEQLKKAKEKADSLNQQIQQADSTAKPPELQKLQDAIEDLQKGNLSQPQFDVQQVAEQLQQSSEQLKNAEAAELSEQLAAELSKIAEQIDKLREQRQPEQPEQSDEQSTETPADERNPITDAVDRIQQLADATQELADQLKDQDSSIPAAQQNANATAANTADAVIQAKAGRLTKSSQQLRDASRSASKSADAMQAATSLNSEQQQMRGLQNELNRIAEVLDNLSKDNRSQAAAQQQAQQDVAKQTSELPQNLAELAERMALEALQMQQQAQQASNAQQLAQQAQQNSEQASAQLQQGELGQAGESGQQAADQLSQIANAEQTSDQLAKDPNALVPNEVGESVADALQKLQQAAKAMQQESDQEGQMEPGESGESAEQGNNGEQSQQSDGQESASAKGQPGEGQASPDGQQQQGQPSASQQQLDSAAKSLAQAAKNALPGQFDPSQPPDGEESEQAGSDAMGNSALWDGRIPDDVLNNGAGSRDWGKVADELDSEISTAAGASRDSEYQSLIRRYFKELAKATSDNIAP